MRIYILKVENGNEADDVICNVYKSERKALQDKKQLMLENNKRKIHLEEKNIITFKKKDKDIVYCVRYNHGCESSDVDFYFCNSKEEQNKIMKNAIRNIYTEYKDIKQTLTEKECLNLGFCFIGSHRAENLDKLIIE